MKNWFLNLAFLLFTTVIFAQSGVITGEVIDGDYNAPLMGAGVQVKGTTRGVSTDMDGKYSIKVDNPTGTLEFTYLGYVTKAIPYKLVNGKAHLKVTLASDQQNLGEVVVTAKSSVIDVAQERKTPVAVSTIQAAEIVEKLGTRELPEILNRTPSIYATKGGGGFGDSKVNMRGFSSKNVAVMVNGMPVNDMEAGTVYFSNWTGLSDVTSAMQVQRGLGASKLAIASVGGTLNFILRAADMHQGGNVVLNYGSNGEYKGTVSYNTGKSLTGWSASVLFSKNAGRKYVDATQFDAYSYYFALGYEPSKKHSFQLMFTGATQSHNQRYYSPSIEDAQKYGGSDDKPNRRYNSDWGYLNGEIFSLKKNIYHKPVAMLNWDWNISESTSLSTVAYASFGRGMGVSGEGEAYRGGFQQKINSDGNTYYVPNKTTFSGLRTPDGLIDVEAAIRYNKGEDVSGLQRITTAGIIGNPKIVPDPLRTRHKIYEGFVNIASVNSHDWYGFLTNLKHQIDDHFTLNLGVDGRYYHGYHHRVITDLLGASGYASTSNRNLLTQPNVIKTTVSDKISFNPFASITSLENQTGWSNDGEVKWAGLFSQFEYSDNKFSAFLQGSTSMQGYQRVDNFMKPGTRAIRNDPSTAMNTKTGFKNIIGYNIKGGVNYNINEHHNVFANAGYYSKQPFFNAVYPNNKNFLNQELTNEKILGLEVGYGFKSERFNANLNLYRTTWKDRYESQKNNLTLPSGTVTAYANIFGIQEIHQGVELEATANITQYLKLNAALTLGDWFYKGNAKSYLINSDNQNIDTQGNVLTGDVAPTTTYLDKVKVGETAQTTVAIGATILPPVKGLKVDIDWRYVDDLYANLNVKDFNTKANAELGALKLPSYNLFDLGASYKLSLTDKQRLTFSAHAYNLLDTYYITESYSSIHASNGDKTYKGISVKNNVYFGSGRTFSFGVRYNF